MSTREYSPASEKDCGVWSDKWYMHALSSQTFLATEIKLCRRECWRYVTLIESSIFTPYEITVFSKTNLDGFLHSSLRRDYRQVLEHFIGQTKISGAKTIDA